LTRVVRFAVKPSSEPFEPTTSVAGVGHGAQAVDEFVRETAHGLRKILRQK